MLPSTRRAPRSHYSATVVYRTPTTSGEGQLGNVSETGVFVQTQATPAVGEQIRIALLTDHPGVEFQGEVRWTNAGGGQPGFGVEVSAASSGYPGWARTIVDQRRPPAPSAIQRRPARRAGVSVRVAIEAGTVCDEGELRDISASGARIERTNIPLDVGTEVRITFATSLRPSASEVVGRIVRKTAEGGYAVQFDAVDPLLQAALREPPEGTDKIFAR